MMSRLLFGLMRAAALAAALSFVGPVLAQTPTPAPTVNSSVTIATGNTFQTILNALGAPPAALRSLTIENNNTNGDGCWITVDGGSPTKAVAMYLLPGGSYTRYFPYIPSAKIQATCTTTSDTLYVDTQ